MLTAGAKLWYALTALALAAAAVYFVTSSGEKYGTFVLAFAAIAAAVLGTTSTVVRDGDVPTPADGGAERQSPQVEALPAMWPALGALGVVVTVIGLAAGSILLYVGIAILVVTLVEWMVQSWAERSTPDPSANLGVRNRLMFPIEIPALAVLGVGLVVLTVSRMLLALPKTGAVIFASVVAVAILGLAAALAAKPRIGASVLSGAMVIGAVLLVVGGIVGGVVGEREFEDHGAEDDHAEPEGGGTAEPGADASVTSRGERPDAARRGEDEPETSAEEPPADQIGEAEVDPTPGDSESVGDPIRSSPDNTTSVSTP